MSTVFNAILLDIALPEETLSGGFPVIPVIIGAAVLVVLAVVLIAVSARRRKKRDANDAKDKNMD